MEKSERLRIFFDRLMAEKESCTYAEARALLDSVLIRVEDEHSNVPFDPKAAESLQALDGRMYPPRDDNEKGSTTTFRRFRAKGNVIFFGTNGSIRIENLHGDLLVDKAGADGRRVEEL